MFLFGMLGLVHRVNLFMRADDESTLHHAPRSTDSALLTYDAALREDLLWIIDVQCEPFRG